MGHFKEGSKIQWPIQNGSTRKGIVVADGDSGPEELKGKIIAAVNTGSDEWPVVVVDRAKVQVRE